MIFFSYNIRKNSTFNNVPTYNSVGTESTVEYSIDADLNAVGDVIACGVLDAGAHKVDLHGMFNYLNECLFGSSIKKFLENII